MIEPRPQCERGVYLVERPRDIPLSGFVNFRKRQNREKRERQTQNADSPIPREHSETQKIGAAAPGNRGKLIKKKNNYYIYSNDLPSFVA